MTACIRSGFTILWAIAIASFGLAGEKTGSPSKPLPRLQLPEDIFAELVQEANDKIAFQLKTPGLGQEHVRSQALLIALAAQHRMAHKQGDLRQLATLRDAAVRLARAADLDKPINEPEVRKQAHLLAQFPKLEPEPSASLELFRLKGCFEQEDIDRHFGGWKFGSMIERDLMKLEKQKPPLTTDQLAKLERIGYKVALLAELLREFDDHIPPQKAAQRKEWVALATEVQYTAWDLAEQARAGNGDMSHKSIVRINQACQTCHAKFRD